MGTVILGDLPATFINEIELTDPVASAEKSKVVADFDQPRGVNRKRLGSFS